MKSITLLCGLAGSGKSTWLRNNVKDEVIVCPDEIRSKIFGVQFHPPVEPMVWSFAKGMARILLEQGKSIIIDATNLTVDRRKDWLNLAIEFDVDATKIVVISCPLDVVKERNRLRSSGKKVPLEVIERQFAEFEMPVTGEAGSIELVEGDLLTFNRSL